MHPAADPYALVTVPEVKDEYLVGDALLVAPIAPGQKSRSVVLPSGKWFDFYTGRFAGEAGTITVTPPLNQIPLFVKDGGLIPMIPERLFAPESAEVLPLEVRHYGTAPGAMALYDDDGETFDYERGVRSWTQLRMDRDTDGKWAGRVIADPSGQKWRYASATWVQMTE